jgi:pimeloyl-ACP methyl ester carboxylesterase
LRHVSQSRRIDGFWNVCQHRGRQFVKSKLAPRDSTRTSKWANAAVRTSPSCRLSFFNILSLSEHNQLDEATRYNMTAIIGLPAGAVDEMAQAPWWPGLVAVAPTLVYDHKASHDIETDPDWRSRWSAVTVPTVVYSGDQTFPGLPEAADAVAAALPNAQRRVLSGQDHGPAPEAIVPELVRFLRSIA